MTRDCDVAIIGAGTAGLTAESAARKAGARTLLIDPEFSGTTCATVGCMPSKLLIAAADAAHGVRAAATFGISAEPSIDGPAVFARVRDLRDRFAQGVRDRIANLPEGTCLRSRARFTGPTALALDTGEAVEARAIVVATGARASIPKPYRDLPNLLTNETVFELDDLPDSLGVIGAGPIGLELAQAFARLGVRVHLFDIGDRLAALQDPAVNVRLKALLAEEIDLHLDTEAQAQLSGRGLSLTWDGGSAEVSHLLIAAGRPPALDDLDLERSGLALDGDGMPDVDPHTLRCGQSAIFLAGDVNGERPVLHEASAEGTIAGANAGAFPEVQAASRSVPFVLTFTRPEVAEIGAIGRDGDLVGEADYRDQGRARVEARNHGLLRLYAEPGTSRLTGATLCAPDGGHLAHLLAWAIGSGATASELLDRPFYHPTLEEGVSTALKAICAQCDLPRPWSRPDGPRPGGG